MTQDSGAGRNLTSEGKSKGGRRGGFRRAIVLSDAQLKAIGRKGAEARWGGLTPEERKIERAKGRAPWPRCACGKFTIGVAKHMRHKCPAAEAANEEKTMVAGA